MKRKAKAHSESGWAIRVNYEDGPMFMPCRNSDIRVFDDEKSAQVELHELKMAIPSEVVRVRVTEQPRARKGGKR